MAEVGVWSHCKTLTSDKKYTMDTQNRNCREANTSELRTEQATSYKIKRNSVNTCLSAPLPN